MGSKKLTIQEMQLLAFSRGGKCLSKKYVNSRTKLEWECSEGHRWETTPAKVRYGQWCPSCVGNKKKTIDGMQKLAESHGGKCLSEKYQSNHKPLLWKCHKRHVFETSYVGVQSAIAKGGFCTKCGVLRRAAKRKSTIEEMRECI